MSINADSGHHLPLKLQKERISNRTHGVPNSPTKPPGSKHPFLLSTHLWISVGGRDHSLDDYFGNIFPEKSSCDSQNIFLPPLPMTFKVVLLLPAVLNGCHEICSYPWWFVLAHTHARTHVERAHWQL